MKDNTTNPIDMIFLVFKTPWFWIAFLFLVFADAMLGINERIEQLQDRTGNLESRMRTKGTARFLTVPDVALAQEISYKPGFTTWRVEWLMTHESEVITCENPFTPFDDRKCGQK
jgi:hypothetical protein